MTAADYVAANRRELERMRALVQRLSDEQLPIEDPTQCGGLNTSLSDGTITLGSPLAPGATIDVVFLLGVEQTGYFRFYINVEALESSGAVGKTSFRPASSKKPPALPVSTPGKPPATSTTPVITPPATPVVTPPVTRPATPGVTPPATQGVTPPARPAITPGVWRKLSPDATPDEPPATPAAKRTRRDSR